MAAVAVARLLTSNARGSCITDCWVSNLLVTAITPRCGNRPCSIPFDLVRTHDQPGVSAAVAAAEDEEQAGDAEMEAAVDE